tara:strand:- start:198 stop:911 length:714 start_codon:yes stop_codon:yes gene_type:complete
MYAILSRLERIENYVSDEAYRGRTQDIVRKAIAIRDCIPDDRCKGGLYDPVALECFDVKFKVSLGQHCFHIDTIQGLLLQRGIVMKPIRLMKAVKEGKYIINPLTNLKVPVSFFIERLIYIMKQKYYQVHISSLKNVVEEQSKFEKSKEIQNQKEENYKLVVRNIIDDELTIQLMDMLLKMWGHIVPSYDDLLYIIGPSSGINVSQELKDLVTKQYTKNTWDPFAKLLNLVQNQSRH